MKRLQTIYKNINKWLKHQLKNKLILKIQNQREYQEEQIKIKNKSNKLNKITFKYNNRLVQI